MSSKKSKLLESAQKNFLKGLYDKSVMEYRQVIQLDPADIRHRQRLAEVLTKANRKDEAIGEYTSLAKHYIDSVHYLKAISVYKLIQKLDPTNPDISLTLASLNEKQGLIGNATSEYAAAIRIYEASGENLKALKALESMLAVDPGNSAVRLRVAEKYFSVGREEQAANELVTLARDLQERSDENGFMLVSEKINQLFAAKAATLFAQINEGNEPEEPAVEPPKPAAVEKTPIAPKPVAPEKPVPPKPAAVEEPAPPEKPVTAPKPAVIEQPVPVEKASPVVVPDSFEISDDFARFDEMHPTDEVVEEVEELEELEEIEEEIEEFEELEELEEVEDLPAEPVETDWEEEIDLDAVASGSTIASEHSVVADEEAEFEFSGEPESELEDIELELEIEEEEEEQGEIEQEEIEQEEVEQEEGVELTGNLPPSPEEFQFADSLPVESDGSFDLGKELSGFVDELDFDLLKADHGDAGFDLTSPSGFMKSDLDKEDAESHYSLGLAYREMGLFDEAISEFIVASHSAGRKIDCLILQGTCLRENGDADKAVEILSNTLKLSEVDEDRKLGIKYELAMCYEALDNKKMAKQLYREILTTKPEFSDTAARFSKL